MAPELHFGRSFHLPSTFPKYLKLKKTMEYLLFIQRKEHHHSHPKIPKHDRHYDPEEYV